MVAVHGAECVLTKESFIEMNTSTEDSKDLDPEYLAGIFHRIQEKEIDVLGEPGSGADQGGVKGGKGGWRKNSRRGRLVGVLSQLNPMSRRAADEAAAKEAQAVRETTRSVFQKVGIYAPCPHPDCATRPALQRSCEVWVSSLVNVCCDMRSQLSAFVEEWNCCASCRGNGDGE